MSTSRTKAWLAAIAIFIVGAVVGGTGATMVGVRLLRRALRAPATAPSYADRAAERIANELTSSLKLTPDESLHVHTILEGSAVNLKNIREHAGQEVTAELRNSTEKLAASLPPEKRPELYHLIARRYERLGLPPPIEPGH